MANRRMFARAITESDAFTDMPLSTQALYFHLGMETDDDGFVVAPRRIQRAIGATDDDMRILAAKGFVIIFESGVLVVTHHRMNNTLRNDRYKPTSCASERAQLEALETGAYSLNAECVLPDESHMLPSGIPSGNQTPTNGSRNITEHNLTEPDQDTLSGKPDHSPIVGQVIEYLNEKTGRRYKPTTKASARHIRARIAEGYELDDFKRVIDTKTAQWLNDSKMSAYLRPETLFGPKFEGYANEQQAVRRDDYSQYDI